MRLLRGNDPPKTEAEHPFAKGFASKGHGIECRFYRMPIFPVREFGSRGGNVDDRDGHILFVTQYEVKMPDDPFMRHLFSMRDCVPRMVITHVGIEGFCDARFDGMPALEIRERSIVKRELRCATESLIQRVIARVYI